MSLGSQSEDVSRSIVVRTDAGRSLLELIIVVAMVALILGAGISRVNAGMYGAEASARELAANLRLSRSQAVGTGYHYRVNVAAGSYAINRMVPGAGNAWVVDASTPTRTVNLPKSVTVSQGTGAYEF